MKTAIVILFLIVTIEALVLGGAWNKICEDCHRISKAEERAERQGKLLDKALKLAKKNEKDINNIEGSLYTVNKKG